MTWKVLTFGTIEELETSIVDESQLGKGIIFTSLPHLHSSEDTIERMIYRHNLFSMEIEEDSYCQNLRKCQLTEVDLILV